jgi:hypothetical protein
MKNQTYHILTNIQNFYKNKDYEDAYQNLALFRVNHCLKHRGKVK